MSHGRDAADRPAAFQPAFDYLQACFGAALSRLNYPPWWSLKDHFWRRNIYSMISDRACEDFCERMRGMSEGDLDGLAASFKLENCEVRKSLEDLLREMI